MRGPWRLGAAGSVCVLALMSGPGAGAQAGGGQTLNSGWALPAGAADEKNPLTVGDAVLAAGRKVFASRCQRCHGPEGRGDGPDANRAYRERMDLTNPDRAPANPDGIVFHKIRIGRSSPRMPAFGEELSPEQTWAVVAYVQSLRRRMPSAR
jgi:mono/diheme cytochrome c family protein